MALALRKGSQIISKGGAPAVTLQGFAYECCIEIF
jgi:hypothetical protein